MKPATSPTLSPRAGAIGQRFERLTGFPLRWAHKSALPVALRLRPTPSPEELLAAPGLRPRTRNALARHMAVFGREKGPWTLDRLLRLRGFGLTTLVDVLEAVEGPSTRERTPAAPGQLLDEASPIRSAAARERRKTPSLDALIRAIAAQLPATESDVARLIHRQGGPDTLRDLASIEQAIRFRRDAPPFAVLRRSGLVLAVDPAHLAVIARALQLAVRLASTRGPVSLPVIAFSVGATDVELLTRALGARAGFVWLDRALGWFWIRSPRCRLVGAVRSLLRREGPEGGLSDAALTAALQSRWSSESPPSPAVVRAFCALQPALEVTGETIHLRR